MGWIVYDTSYLDKFYSFVTARIGAVMPIALIILAILVGIAIVIRLVKKFSKG